LPQTNWNVHPIANQPHTLILRLDKPLETNEQHLRVSLLFEDPMWTGTTLGCFRLSATDDEHAVGVEQIHIPGVKDLVTVWTLRAAARFRAGSCDEAIQLLNQAIEYGPGGSAYDHLILALACWRSGRKDEGRLWYEKALAARNDIDSQVVEPLLRMLHGEARAEAMKQFPDDISVSDP
jgi:hypothetical protein